MKFIPVINAPAGTARGKSAEQAARKRLDAASQTVAKILDDGERDPTWHESQELENAALELGRLLNARKVKP